MMRRKRAVNCAKSYWTGTTSTAANVLTPRVTIAPEPDRQNGRCLQEMPRHEPIHMPMLSRHYARCHAAVSLRKMHRAVVD